MTYSFRAELQSFWDGHIDRDGELSINDLRILFHAIHILSLIILSINYKLFQK